MDNVDKQKSQGWWSHVHWLAVLEQQGSFTAAAQHLSVSKAAVSQRMRELEQALGAPLIKRTTRSVRLTEQGQQLVDDTRDSFEHISRTLAQTKDAAGEPRGLLRVSAPVALARQQLVKHLPAFFQRYPGIRIHLDMSDRLVNLTSEGFDVAIRHVSSPPDTSVAHLLCHTRSVVVASPAYLAASGTPQSPQELVAHQCLAYPRAQGGTMWRFEASHKRKQIAAQTVAVAGSFAANNSESLRDAALAGMGIALLPDFSAQDALRAGALVQVLPNWRAVGVFAPNLYVLRPYAHHVPQAVTLLLQHLRHCFAPGFDGAP